MAAVSALVPLTVPGLHCSPTIDQLRESARVYNGLPDDKAQPNIAELHLRVLAEIFERHDVQTMFGLHLIHGHLNLHNDTIMLGHSIDKPHGCWTKPVSLHDINPEDIHGHIFRISPDDRLVAYEYRYGPLADIDSVNPAFFSEFIDYLKAQDLTNVLGLQVLSKGASKDMVEIVLQGSGTVMLDSDSAEVGSIYRTTGWVLGGEDGITTFKGGESHAKTTKGTHQVFIDGKPLSTIDALMAALRGEGIIT